MFSRDIFRKPYDDMSENVTYKPRTEDSAKIYQKILRIELNALEL